MHTCMYVCMHSYLCVSVCVCLCAHACVCFIACVCVSMYVGPCVHVCVCVYACVCMYEHACGTVCVCVHMFVRVSLLAYVYLCIWVRVYMCVSVCMHVCACMSMHVGLCGCVCSYPYLHACARLCVSVCMHEDPCEWICIAIWVWAYVTVFWKTDRIVTLGPFHFIDPANGYTCTLHIHSAIIRLGWLVCFSKVSFAHPVNLWLRQWDPCRVLHGRHGSEIHLIDREMSLMPFKHVWAYGWHIWDS